MHKVPTTLLHSLEGMLGLDWEKLLKLQSQDGSFLFSPSSTAYALMQTKDENCLSYLNKIVQRFKGGGKFPFCSSSTTKILVSLSTFLIFCTFAIFQYQMFTRLTYSSTSGLWIACNALEFQDTSRKSLKNLLTMLPGIVSNGV